jgi:hypothetical protein
MENDLLRQRRNLMITSTGLLLFDFADVTVSKISILGTELLIGNAEILNYFAWFMWGYFLLRYYQYLKIDGNLGISEGLKSRLEGKARREIFRKLDIATFSGNIELHRKNLKLEYSVNEYKPNLAATQSIETGDFAKLKVARWMFESWLDLATHTPKVTDHILPFVLAASAPMISIARAALSSS